MEHVAGPLADYGLALVFFNVLLTQAGVPLPAIPTLVVAGALAQQGDWPATEVIALAIAACLLGDLPWYYAGRHYGSRVINLLCRIAIEPDYCVRQTENKFERWGLPSLMIAKFVPGFAMIAPPMAGAFRLPLAPFLGYSALGALLWSGVAVGAGWIFHAQVGRALEWAARMGGSTVLLAAVVVLYIGIKWVEQRLFIRLLRMVRITVDELHALMQEPVGPVILDVRSSAARRLDPRRIPGAVLVEAASPAIAGADIPLERDVVIYCT